MVAVANGADGCAGRGGGTGAGGGATANGGAADGSAEAGEYGTEAEGQEVHGARGRARTAHGAGNLWFEWRWKVKKREKRGRKEGSEAR